MCRIRCGQAFGAASFAKSVSASSPPPVFGPGSPNLSVSASRVPVSRERPESSLKGTPLLPDQDWCIESNLGEYVVFNASDDDAAHVARILDMQFGVVRWEACVWLGADGVEYGRYAPLGLSTDMAIEAVLQHVRAVFSGEPREAIMQAKDP